MLFNVCDVGGVCCDVVCVVVVLLCFDWLCLVCASVCLLKYDCAVVCALSRGVVMCCVLCVWLLFHGFVWFVRGLACAIVWRVWFCDGVFSLCVACVRVCFI